MKRRMLAAMLWVTFAGVFVSVANPQGSAPGPSGPRRGHQGVDREAMFIYRVLHNQELVEQLGLSDEQVTTLKEGMFALREKQIEIRSELEKAGLEQARLLTESAVDEEALMAAVEAAGQANTELAKLRMKQLLLVKTTLSAEQLATAKELAREHMETMRARRGEKRERGEAGSRRGRGRKAGENDAEE